jgi:hypothetical protein
MECSACDGEVHPINDCCNWDAPLTSGGARSSKHIGELELMTWGFDIATDNPVYARIFREMTEILGYDVRDDMSSGEAMQVGAALPTSLQSVNGSAKTQTCQSHSMQSSPAEVRSSSAASRTSAEAAFRSSSVSSRLHSAGRAVASLATACEGAIITE